MERFERRGFGDVLPSIRKTGMYALLAIYVDKVAKLIEQTGMKNTPSVLSDSAQRWTSPVQWQRKHSNAEIMNSGLDGRQKDQSYICRRQSPNRIPRRSQPCDPLPSVETTVFFRSLKIEGCYGTNKENFICGQRTVGYMVGAPACGWVKTGRTPSAGNTEKATNPRKNERVEDFVPWFDRDKMAYFHSSRIFGEDGLARIEIGAGRRIDEGIAPHKRKKRPSFSGGTPAFRLLARLTKA